MAPSPVLSMYDNVLSIPRMLSYLSTKELFVAGLGLSLMVILAGAICFCVLCYRSANVSPASGAGAHETALSLVKRGREGDRRSNGYLCDQSETAGALLYRQREEEDSEDEETSEARFDEYGGNHTSEHVFLD